MKTRNIMFKCACMVLFSLFVNASVLSVEKDNPSTGYYNPAYPFYWNEDFDDGIPSANYGSALGFQDAGIRPLKTENGIVDFDSRLKNGSGNFDAVGIKAVEKKAAISGRVVFEWKVEQSTTCTSRYFRVLGFKKDGTTGVNLDIPTFSNNGGEVGKLYINKEVTGGYKANEPMEFKIIYNFDYSEDKGVIEGVYINGLKRNDLSNQLHDAKSFKQFQIQQAMTTNNYTPENGETHASGDGVHMYLDYIRIYDAPPQTVETDTKFFMGDTDITESGIVPGDVVVKASIDNEMDSKQTITLISVLYEKQDDTLLIKDIKSASKDVNMFQADEISTAALTVPNDDKEYCIKAFVWDKIELLKPLKSAHTLEEVSTDD